MKKTLFILLLVFFSLKSYSQAGDLHIGLQGGYATKYKNPLYGLNLSYDVSNLLQVSFTGLMNPDFIKKDEFNPADNEKLSTYSFNLDARLFLINFESFATGPSIGAQYLTINHKEHSMRNFNGPGFNIGWHIRANITETVRLTGGWRYNTMKEGESYNLFYLGIGYAFNVY